MSLKEQYIQQTENHINQLRKKRELLEEELTQLVSSENEAREMLQFFRTGNVPTANGHAGNNPTGLSQEDFHEAVRTVASDKPRFTSSDVAELLGKEYQKTLTNRLRGIVERGGNSGFVVRVKTGGPGIAAVYSLNPNYKEED